MFATVPNFLTKIIIVVIIALIKTERIYQKDKKKEISILPNPWGCLKSSKENIPAVQKTL